VKTEHYDIVIISDLRFHGGNSASIAESVKAQAAAGYTTALIHHPSAALKRDRAFNGKIVRCVREGLADLVPAGQPLNTRLLMIRSPRVFAPGSALPPGIKADVSVLVVNYSPFNTDRSKNYYDIAALQEIVGRDCLWAPTGPLIRRALVESGHKLNIAGQDWHNIINVDEWHADRSAFAGSKPVIGRSSRDSADKWPESREEILAAYPDDGRYAVRILGGAKIPQRILGRLPDNWDVYPFNAVSPAKFLRKIDFFVYFHHPLLIEAFGRTVIEALASGAPAILPHHFETLFRDACIYASPEEVPDVVSGLYGDRQAYLSQSSRGVDFVREHFSYRTHINHVKSLIGEPSVSSSRPSRAHPPAARNVLFVASNGIGMGHLNRAMAVARRLPAHLKPVFLTMSQGISFARRQGFYAEYFPTKTQAQCNSETWNRLLEDRVREVIRTYDPAAVVLDSVSIYDGFLRVMRADAERPFIWCRRPMWKKSRGGELSVNVAAFDLIVEPGDFAGAFDAGWTASRRREVARVPPVLYLDESEVLDRTGAAQALGLDPDRPAVLIQLGAGNEEDLVSPFGLLVQGLSRVPGLQIVAAESMISDSPLEPSSRVKKVSVYPLSKYCRAFDFVVSASGYNSYHELIGFAVPAIFVPNLQKSTDDQAARAGYARDAGVGLWLEKVTSEGIDDCLKIMLDEKKRAAMAARCRELFPGNGAGEAANIIEDWSLCWPEIRRPGINKKLRGGTPSFLKIPLRNLRSLASRVVRCSRRDILKAAGHPLKTSSAVWAILFNRRRWGKKGQITVVIVALGISPEGLERLVEEVHSLRADSPAEDFFPVFVTDCDSFHVFRRRRSFFEYIPPESEWTGHNKGSGWNEFKDGRIRDIIENYRPEKVIEVDDGSGSQTLREKLLNGLPRQAVSLQM